uniref:Uncharacterized protein n=1 Tax=Canis lupus familiaris TaxID=9615 RepID=A0A8C0Z1T5_CANLF
MDLCQKKETELEISENNEIQSPEETELTYTCSDERSEKNHVCCLLNISDITLEQDEKANEFVIRTGWEEAVQGWGRTFPTACIWPRKKPKKARVGEVASGCLLCGSLSQGSTEARPQAGKLGSGVPAEVGPEKDQGSPSQTQGTPQGPTAASREISKICFPTYSQGEKKSLQIKEFVWCKEDWATTETIRGKDPRSASRGPSISDSLTSRALLVLPPLKASPPNGLDVLGKKSKNFFLQPEEKVLGVEKDECVACTYGLKTVDGKGEKRPVELAKHPKVNDTLPFPPRGLPPHSRARSHAARGSPAAGHRPQSLSAAVPARCAFEATNCSSRRPPAPPPRSSPLDCTLGTGGRVASGRSEARRAPASRLSAANTSSAQPAAAPRPGWLARLAAPRLRGASVPPPALLRSARKWAGRAGPGAHAPQSPRAAGAAGAPRGQPWRAREPSPPGAAPPPASRGPAFGWGGLAGDGGFSRPGAAARRVALLCSVTS